MRHSSTGLLVGLVLALAACGEDARRFDEDVAAARAAFERGEHSEALRLGRAVLARAGDEGVPAPPAAYQVAAEAAFRLDRLGEALELAEAGLALDGLDPGERADLRWIVGMASLQRYRALQDEDDWARANIALEEAAEAGTHRLVAATAVAIMNVDRDEERFAKFARRVVREWPDSTEARTLRPVMEARGIEP